jgi:hypothetical protein
MTRLLLVGFLLVTLGCSSRDLTRVGLAAGVVRESKVVEIPADEYEAFIREGIKITRSVCTRRTKLCLASLQPGAACKLPVAECDTSEQNCDRAYEMIDLAERQLDKPRIEWDPRGTARLVGHALAIIREFK